MSRSGFYTYGSWSFRGWSQASLARPRSHWQSV